MIRPHESLLDVRLLEPVLDGDTAQYEVDARPKIAWSGIDFLLPVCKHAFTVGMEFST